MERPLVGIFSCLIPKEEFSLIQIAKMTILSPLYMSFRKSVKFISRLTKASLSSCIRLMYGVWKVVCLFEFYHNFTILLSPSMESISGCMFWVFYLVESTIYDTSPWQGVMSQSFQFHSFLSQFVHNIPNLLKILFLLRYLLKNFAIIINFYYYCYYCKYFY